MLDKETLNEMEKYIDRRINKANKQLIVFGKNEQSYLIYKSIISELRHIKRFIIVKRGNVK